MKVTPMGVFLAMPAGWINRHQPDVITKIRVPLVQGLLVSLVGLLVLAMAGHHRHVADQGT